MKVRDLPPGTPLQGKKVRTPRGVVGYYVSEGNCVIMLAKSPEPIIAEEGSRDETRLYPQIVGQNSDVKDWDVVDDNIAVNCTQLTTLQHINCVKE